MSQKYPVWDITDPDMYFCGRGKAKNPNCSKGAIAMNIINATPHPIVFEVEGELITIEPSGYTLKADATEEVVKVEDGITYVKTVFKPSVQGLQELNELKTYKNPIIVGSIISAQAYPGEVVALVPVPGFERVPPQEKRFLANKFTIF